MTTPESANTDHPQMAAAPGRVEPVPRRIRARLAGRTVLDTVAAHYGWEVPYYPQYHVPVGDIDPAVLLEEPRRVAGTFGEARSCGLQVDGEHRSGAGLRYGDDAPPGVADTVRFDWDAMDSWWEEDEQVFVHPRSPYVRVDALRSRRHVRVELDGVLLADSTAPVLVFETGLPTRFYLDPADVRMQHLVPSGTQTQCPYKGSTSAYWSVRLGGSTYDDLAWRYDFPTRQLLPVTGLIAFYDERVDVTVDGVRRPRPSTHLAS